MAKMLTQLDLLTKHVFCSNRKNMNAIGAAREVTYDSVPYDGGYSEEVHYIGN